MEAMFLIVGLLIGFVLGDRQAWLRKALRTEEWLASAMSFMICSKDFVVSVTRLEDGETHSATFQRVITPESGKEPKP